MSFFRPRLQLAGPKVSVAAENKDSERKEEAVNRKQTNRPVRLCSSLLFSPLYQKRLKSCSLKDPIFLPQISVAGGSKIQISTGEKEKKRHCNTPIDGLKI